MQYKSFISGFGLFSTIVVTVIGVGIFSYPEEVVSAIGTDGWVLTIFAGIITYVLLYIAYSAIKHNEYNKFYYILKNNFGILLGSILAIVFVVYNIVSISIGMRIFVEVIKMYLLEKTPTEFILIVTILTGIYLVRGDLENVIRFNEISFWVMFIPVIIILLFTSNNADFSNILPVFDNSPYRYISSLKTAIYSFSGIEIIYLVAPFIKNRSYINKISRISLVFITVFYVLIIILCLSVFSTNETDTLIWPTITMIKSITLNGAFIERWEGIVMAMWVIFYFTTFSNIYYMSSDILKDVFKFRNMNIPVIILGMIIYMISIYPKNIAILYKAENSLILPLFVFNIIILPIVLLFLKRFKGKSFFKKVLPLLLMCTLFSGCWDKVEIERKQLVSVIGIDAGKDIDKYKNFKNIRSYDPVTSMDLEKIHITFGVPDLSQLGPEKGAQSQDKYIDADGYSMQDVVSKAGLKSSRSIKFSHTGLLVFSKKIMEYPDVMKEILDYLQREPSLNRNMYIVLVQGDMEQYVKMKTQMEKNMETYILGLIENDSKNTEIIPVTLNDFLVQMNENGNSLLPKIVMNEDNKDIKIDGSTAIKNFKVKGDLNSVETADIELLRGKLKGGKKTIYVEGHPVDIDIDNIKRKVSSSITNGRLVFNINLIVEAQLKDYYLGKQVFSVDILNYMQNNFNSSIKSECEQVFKVVQKDMEIDPVGLKENLEKYHPDIWNRVKNNWESAYKSSIVNINVDTQIRRIGVVK